MKNKQLFVINLLRRLWPSFGEEVFYLRERLRHQRQFGQIQKNFWLDHYAPLKPVVLSGPFAGMKYLRDNVLGAALPRWLGTYESELHEVICSRISKKKYDMILVVGSAEGYYSCGFARLFPGTPVLSFETTAFSRWQQRRLVKLNKLRNVQIRGLLKAAEFVRLVKNKKVLCLLDIEGSEYEFCSGSNASCLGSVDLLVEIHAAGAHPAQEVLKQIKTALEPSHQIQVYDPVPRNMAEFQAKLGSTWSLEALRQAAEEHRGVQQWLWAEGRQD